MKTAILPTTACLVVVVAMALWPADVPWGGDDVTLMHAAARFNGAHRPADVGLTGTFGVPYGPVPTQVYQLLLLATHDLPTVVQLRAGLTASVSAIALLWLAKSLGWSLWLAPLAMLSPFFWFYTRLLWDNTFAIPIGATLVAAYAAHLRGGRGLTVAVAAAVVLPLIHPMTLPLVVPFAAHAMWFHRPALARRWKSLAVVAAVVAVSSGPYLVRAIGRLPSPPTTASNDGYAPLSRPAAFAYPLLAGRLLSGFNFFDNRGPERGWETTVIGTVARTASAVAFPLVWVGVVVAVRRVSQPPASAGGIPRPKGRGYDPSPAETIPTLCLVALAVQSLMDCAMRVSPYPHYFCGTWAAAVVCLWAGLRTLGRWAVPVGIAYATALVVSTASFAVDVHRGHGGTVWHGPTLGAQQKAPGVHPGLR